MNIYAGNLSRGITEEDLQNAFENYGTVDNVNLIKDRYSGESKGFGFIEMPTKEEAKAAIEGLDGTNIKGKNIRVNEALPPDGDRGRRNNNRGARGGGRGHGRRW